MFNNITVVEPLHTISEESQEYVEMQKPTTAVLHPDKQETGKTKPYAVPQSEDTKQKSQVEVDLPTRVSAKPDKIKIPEVCNMI